MLNTIVFLLLSVSHGFSFQAHLKYHNLLRKNVACSMQNPTNPQENIRSISHTIFRSLFATSAAASIVLQPKSSLAIGSLAEFQNQPIILQDITFNVVNTYEAAEFFQATFPDLCKVLRNQRVGNRNTTVIGFGADAFKSPKTFTPGVSSFYEDGGHATITFESEELPDNTFAIYEAGNGIQNIKIGAENFRISKAIERGAKIKYAYGWVDLEGVSLPLQLVVGVARDPLMCVSLRVSDLAASTAFFTQQLGMKALPFPLARAAGSNFEQAQPKGSIYLGYVSDSLGILLLPSDKKDPPLVVGDQLKALTFIVDDKAAEVPPAAKEFLAGGVGLITSPDGYPVLFKKYSDFEKTATTSVE